MEELRPPSATPTVSPQILERSIIGLSFAPKEDAINQRRPRRWRRKEDARKTDFIVSRMKRITEKDFLRTLIGDFVSQRRRTGTVASFVTTGRLKFKREALRCNIGSDALASCDRVGRRLHCCSFLLFGYCRIVIGSLDWQATYLTAS